MLTWALRCTQLELDLFVVKSYLFDRDIQQKKIPLRNQINDFDKWITGCHIGEGQQDDEDGSHNGRG